MGTPRFAIVPRLIGIKAGAWRMKDCEHILGLEPVEDVGKSVNGPQFLRFAVGAFHSWEGVETALRDLSLGGTTAKSFNYLGLQRVLARASGTTANASPLPLQELPFPGHAETISCTPGPLAERLSARLRAGAPTLKAALGQWLIPRHAAHLQEGVEEGKIILWVQLFDVDDERRAYESLLNRSSNAVGVHDITAG
jgi:hypothetical protein